MDNIRKVKNVLGATVSFYFAPLHIVAEIPEAINGIITSPVVFTSGETFFVGESQLEGSDYSENTLNSKDGEETTVSFTAFIPGDDNALRVLFQKMLKHRYIVLCVDSNGNKRLLGSLDNGLRFKYKFVVNQKISGGQGYSLEFSHKSINPPPFYESTFTSAESAGPGELPIFYTYDSKFFIRNIDDSSKTVWIDASQLGTGQTRKIIMPDTNVDLAAFVDFMNTFSNPGIEDIDGLTDALTEATNDAITTIRDGVDTAGNTLSKLYNFIIAQTREISVANIAARDALNIDFLPTNVFVTDDGDGNWALYRATTTGVAASFIKISDPDLLNAFMTASAIKSAYESNSDTNAFTDALLSKLNGIATAATANQSDAYLLNRSNHTGTQTASTISDFNTAAQSAVTVNNRKIIGYSNEGVSVTGTTSEKVVANILIPANTLSANGVLMIQGQLKRVSGTNAIAHRGYLSDTASNTVGNTGTPVNSVGNATQIGIYSMPATTLFSPWGRTIANKNNIAVNEVFVVSTSANVDSVTSNSAPTSLNIDFSQDIYYVHTIDLVSSSEDGSISNLQLYVNNP